MSFVRRLATSQRPQMVVSLVDKPLQWNREYPWLLQWASVVGTKVVWLFAICRSAVFLHRFIDYGLVAVPLVQEGN